MHTLSSLSQLSHAQKDALILMHQEQIKALQEAVRQLQTAGKMNSRNSSKPPSSDGLNKPAPKSLRVTGQKPTGGQKGHPGRTLSQAAEPDKVVVHSVPDQCQACQSKLPFAYVSETRQVFDLPVLQFEVTEHHAMQAICSCGHVHTAQFPASAHAAVQYGSPAQAAMVHLNLNHAVSVQRTAAMKDFFGLSASQAAVVKAGVAGASILQPTVQTIGQGVVNSAVAHAAGCGWHACCTGCMCWPPTC
jgi:transposase